MRVTWVGNDLKVRFVHIPVYLLDRGLESAIPATQSAAVI